MMTNKYKIKMDMDGVTCDFAGKVRFLLGMSPKNTEELMERVEEESFDKKLMWKAIHAYDTHTPFFYSLDKLPDADDLFDFVIEHFDHEDIGFLTASGYTPVDAAHQKRRWIRKHYGDYQVDVVSKSHDKAVFATSTTILIDDREKSITPWIEAGGIGILHKNSKDTIEQLKKILGI